jgi:hypothetical protein
MLWYHKLRCWLFGHQLPIITGRLRTYTGDWQTWTCTKCKAFWSVPIPQRQKPL